MTCEEFKRHIADLCDTTAPRTDIRKACMEHLEKCDSCRAYYESFMHTVGLLTPKHAPRSRRNRRQRTLQRLLQAAAILLVFLTGVGVGLSDLFSTKAEASPSLPELFDQCIRQSREAKGFSMWAYVRTAPQENFAYIDPEAELLKVHVAVLRQGENACWRIEKAGGRTIVGDGSRQYMWDNTGTGVYGNLQTNFAEDFSLFLQPESILEKIKDALPESPDVEVTVFQPDSSIIVSFRTPADNLSAFFSPAYRNRDFLCTTRCVFNQQDYHLKEIEIRWDNNGKETVVFRSGLIRYDTPLAAADITRRPGEGQITWMSADGPHIDDPARLSKLQKETAVEAAQRILKALIAGQPHEEALFYYAASLPALTEEMKNCRVSGLREAPARKDYAGTTVLYELHRPDGSSEQHHINLRKDNDQQIWMVDGGL